jgi:surface antigen
MREYRDETETDFNIKWIALLALGMTIVLGSSLLVPSAWGAGPTPAQNPYPAHKPAAWAWQNRTDLPANLGQPREWNENAESQGFPVGRYPRKGAVAVFESKVWGAPEVGHVAIVEQVYDDGSYLASEYSDADCRYDSSSCGRVHRNVYPVMAGMSFIYTLRDTRTTWSFATGGSGWTARDLGEGYMGGPGWYYPLAGSDPQLISPELSIPLESYAGIEIVMATGIPVKDPQVQVYFSTEKAEGFTETRSLKVAAKADGELRTYRVDFTNHADWKGTLTRLRIDPSGPGMVGGVRIDLVRLVTRAPQTEAGDFGTYSYTPRSGGGRKSR